MPPATVLVTLFLRGFSHIFSFLYNVPAIHQFSPHIVSNHFLKVQSLFVSPPKHLGYNTLLPMRYTCVAHLLVYCISATFIYTIQYYCFNSNKRLISILLSCWVQNSHILSINTNNMDNHRLLYTLSDIYNNLCQIFITRTRRVLCCS